MTEIHHVVLVPGFWLGEWAWDEVRQNLDGRSIPSSALTLPGLRPDDDGSKVSMADHVEAIRAAVQRAETSKVVLVLHSGTGFSGAYAIDGLPHRIAHAIYVDTFPGQGAPMAADFPGDSYPLPSWEELVADGNSLDGLSEQQLATFRERAVPEPAAALREGWDVSNEDRRGVPSTIVCNSLTQADIKSWLDQGVPQLSELAQLRQVAYVDMPTSHWPMWSEPDKLSDLIASRALQQN